MFNTLLKSALTLILTTLVSGTASIALWRAIGHRPSAAELAICFIGLPAALFFAMTWWRRRSGETPDPAMAQSAPAAPAFDTRRWSILATDVMTPIGHTPADVIQALQDHQRPELDATLRDLAGFPLFAARVADVDMPLASMLADPATTDTCTKDSLRAAAMMLDICRNLAMAADDTLPLDATARPVLHLHALLPERWPAEQRDAVLTGMRSAVSVYWHGDLQAFSHTVGATGMHGPVPSIDIPAGEAHDGRLRLAMVVGGDSYISEDAVSSLALGRQLLTPANPQGKVPGEAAAGLLISARANADRFAHDPGIVMTAAVGAGAARHPGAIAIAHDGTGSDVISRTAVRGSAETIGGTAQADFAEPLSSLLDRLLATTSKGPEDIGAVVSDADHRGPSASELLALTTQRLPHLDPARDHLLAAAGCGDVGAAAFPLALALAAQACTEHGGSVLFVSTQVAQARMALMIEPAIAADTASLPGSD